MAVNWRFNVGLGLITLVLTFYFSFENNTWQTSLFRAMIGFILFFVVGYLVRFLLYMIGLEKEREIAPQGDQAASTKTEDTVNEGEVFQPVTLTSLHGEQVPEKVANTVQTWVSQDREG